MTEAIALLFSYYAQKEDIAPPSPEEFFAYVRNLCLQTYQIVVPGPRRKVSSRFLGSSGPTFSSLYGFLDSIEPLRSGGARNLVSSLVQAHAIGIRALTTYTALVEDSTENVLRTHIAEPFVWFCGILYHDLLNFRDHGLGLSLAFIKDGVAYLTKHVTKIHLSTLFETYNIYQIRGNHAMLLLVKFLTAQLT